jgi:hypothetical protein
MRPLYFNPRVWGEYHNRGLQESIGSVPAGRVAFGVSGEGATGLPRIGEMDDGGWLCVEVVIV